MPPARPTRAAALVAAAAALAGLLAGPAPAATVTPATPLAAFAPARAAPAVGPAASPAPLAAPAAPASPASPASLAAPAAVDDEGAGARMLADVAALVALGPREAGTAAERAAAGHVVDVLRGLGRSPSVTPVPLANGRTSVNVETAFSSGPVEVLLGAHLDTVAGSPGADDDGSGVAVLLELARRLASGRTAVPPGTTVRLVWFGAEEVLAGHGRDVHHAGSRQLAASRAAAGALPHWVLSVDMVGAGATPLAVWLRGTDRAGADVLAAASRFAGAPAAPAERGDISDHEPFARAGSAAAMLWRPDNPAYHGPGDIAVDEGHLLAALGTAEAFVAVAASPWASGRGLAQLLVAGLLARRPDVGAAAHFGARLAAGEPAGAVGEALVRSGEWAGVVAPVARLYRAAFGRHVDPSGLWHWTGALRRGVPLVVVAAAFAGSGELAARAGSLDDAGFVRWLYGNVLGREPDAGGLAHWTGELRSGRLDRAGVLTALSESAEHRARTAAELPVAVAHAGLLGREVDPDALAHWSTRPLREVVEALLTEARGDW